MYKHIKKILSLIVCLMMIICCSQDVEAASLKVRSFSVNCSSTVTQGKKITLKASSIGGIGKKQYKFVYELNKKTYTIKKYSTSKNATLKLSKRGTYTLYVYIKDKRKIVKKQKTIKVVAPYKVKLSTSGKYVNDTIHLSASSTGGKEKKQYKFSYKYKGKRYTIKNYSQSKKVSFQTKKTGKYQFIVECKDSRKKVVSSSKTMNLQYPQLKVSLKTKGKYVTDTIQLIADSSGGKGRKQYQFTYKLNGETHTLKSYSSTKTISFQPKEEGDYQFIVACEDERKKVVTKTQKIKLHYPQLKLSFHVTGKYINEPIQLSADATGGLGEKEYKFTYLHNEKEFILSDFTNNQKILFEPDDLGDYQFIVECKDKRNQTIKKSISLTVEKKPNFKVSLDVLDVYVCQSMKIKANVEGDEDHYQYCFRYTFKDKEVLLQDYSDKDSISFTPEQVGEYIIEVVCQNSEGLKAISTIKKKVIINPARTKVIGIAKSWLGCKESDGSHKKIIDVYNHYNHSDNTVDYKVKYDDAWCDTFVSACFIKAGYASISGTECGCQRHIDNVLKKKGAWEESDNYVPQIGDIIFYHGNAQKCNSSKDCQHDSHHVGLVAEVNGKDLKIIEGNYSDSVKYRTLKVGDSRIRGYGVPHYPR